MVPGVTAGSYMYTNKIGGGEEKKYNQDTVALVAPCATLIGNVHLGPNSSVFYKAILKADVAAHGINTIHTAKEEEQWKSLPVGGYERKKDAGMLDTGSGINHPTIGGANGGGIYVGEGTNIQDACMVTSYEGHTTIGKYVTVGHAAHIHSASVGDESLIGMGAVLKPGCVVESQSFIAAGAVIERGTVVKEGELWGGNPARKLRDLTAEQRGRLRMQAEKYIDVAQSHNHVMELGGNVSDDFMLEQELLGTESAVASNADYSISESKKSIPTSDETVAPANALNGVIINGAKEQEESQQEHQKEKEEDVLNEELRVLARQQSQ